MPPRPLHAEPNPDAAPVAGEAVTIDAVVASQDQQAADRSSRIGRTAVQATPGAALVIIGCWIARLAHIDLDPGTGVDMPSEVVAAWGVVATIAAAWAMNRPKGD